MLFRSHLKMEFVDGDSIGVFAIKDGAIMDDIDNAKLVYNRSRDRKSVV